MERDARYYKYDNEGSPMGRFIRCKMFGAIERCDHFQWIDSLGDRARSMGVSLIVKNEAMVVEDETKRKAEEKVWSY